jgi:hypothetical protein
MSENVVQPQGFNLILNNFVRLLRSDVSLALEVDEECLKYMRTELNMDIQKPENSATHDTEAEALSVNNQEILVI